METLTNWILPLTFIPGVALLINATNSTFIAVKAEIQRLLKEMPEDFDKNLVAQVQRLNLLTYALVSFYVSVSLFAVCSLVGGLFDVGVPRYDHLVNLTLCLGVVFLVAGAILLVVESVLTIKIVRRQCYTAHQEHMKLENNQKY